MDRNLRSITVFVGHDSKLQCACTNLFVLFDYVSCILNWMIPSLSKKNRIIQDICHSWVRFEREYGSLEDYDVAMQKVCILILSLLVNLGILFSL